MVKNIKPCCPACRSVSLAHVGFYAIAPVGVPYEVGTRLTEYEVSQQLLECMQCGKRCLLDDAEKASEIDATGLVWEKNAKGHPIPILCPKCENTQYFVRSALHVKEVDEYVEYEDLKEKVVETGADPVTRNTVTLNYRCGIQGCDGEVVINPDVYELTEQ